MGPGGRYSTTAKTLPATAYFNEEMKLIKSNDGSNN